MTQTKTMTQTEKIYNFMLDHGSITARQAYHMGIMRLASRIADLRRAEIKIKTDFIKVKNRDGSYSHVARYSFLKEGEENV